MRLTQNLRFQANESAMPGADKVFAGERLIHRLAQGLAPQAWNVSPVETWRDGGWLVFCRRGASEMHIILSAAPEGDWLLQIGPKKSSLFERSGQKPSATPDDVYRLACDVHELLEKEDSFAAPRWCWDNFPDARNSMQRPQPATT